MANVYHDCLSGLSREPRLWAVTGVAGFIGSNILERLLMAGQRVVGLDSYVTGHRRNLQEVEQIAGQGHWRNFRLIEGDIRDRAVCEEAFRGVDVVLHQAALGSVPLSLERPEETHAVNVTGFLNVLQAVRSQKVRRLVYASSCAVYGDDPGSPKKEEQLGNAISPYATSKRMNELYADVFGRCFGTETVGLRYFNIYGRRQDPNGAYAAVIPKWIDALVRGEEIRIHGDGETSRDFCQVRDVVQANILAALAPFGEGVSNAICNVGTGVQTTLNALFQSIRQVVSRQMPEKVDVEPTRGPFRSGDIRHSCADIGRARSMLGFSPEFTLQAGLGEALPWYLAAGKSAAPAHAEA